MRDPRWKKVWRELWGSKTRTALVVLSLAVGVFAIGMMTTSQIVLAANMHASFMAVNPSSARLDSEPFDDELLQAIGRMPEVGQAEGRYRIEVRARIGPDTWRNLHLYVVPDFEAIAINTIVSESGAWPPPRRSVLIERAALGMLNAAEGDQLLVETADRKQRLLPIAGVAHDQHKWPANFGVIAYGYITFDTLAWLGQERAFNELYIVAAENPYDKAHAQDVAAVVRDRIERTGRSVFVVNIREPGKHNADSLIQSLALMLGLIGALALPLSGFLVTNTISALLLQQVRQIGVMKAIGARTRQIIQIYLAIVLIYGVLALAVAMPLGAVAAYGFTRFILRLFNFELVSFAVPPSALALQILVGLVVPLLAALYPVIAGTRVTVREAIASQGTSLAARPGRRRILPAALALRLPQTLVLALRNTFRRKGRLALTLATLTLGGAMFIAVVNVQGSLYSTLDVVLQYWKFDADVYFQQPYRVDRLTRELMQVPGVVAVEPWGNAVAFRVRPDGSEREQIALNGPPAETTQIVPLISAGRWLLPEDENALVVNGAFLQEEPDVAVGDTITLKIEGRESPWRVVGVATGQMAGMGPIAYANRPYLMRLTNQVGMSSRVVLTTAEHSAAFQDQVRQALEVRLRAAHLRVNAINTHGDIYSGMGGIFNVFVAVTMVMALLLAVVGGLGLMGLMSLNVLERRQEIGVLRAVGASNSSVLGIVMAEGVFIGLISWLMAAALAGPLTRLLCYAVGLGFLNMPLVYSFSYGAVAIWFAIAVLLAALASFLPAWQAARVAVRDVLAYE